MIGCGKLSLLEPKGRICMKVNPCKPFANGVRLQWFNKWTMPLIEHYAEMFGYDIENVREGGVGELNLITLPDKIFFCGALWSRWSGIAQEIKLDQVTTLLIGLNTENMNTVNSADTLTRILEQHGV